MERKRTHALILIKIPLTCSSECQDKQIDYKDGTEAPAWLGEPESDISSTKMGELGWLNKATRVIGVKWHRTLNSEWKIHWSSSRVSRVWKEDSQCRSCRQSVYVIV